MVYSSLSSSLRHNFSESYGNSLFENDIFYLFPELFLLLGTIFCSIFGVYGSTDKRSGYPSLHRIFPFLGMVLCFGSLFLLWTTPFTNGILCNHSLIYDAMSFYFKGIVLFGGIALFGMSRKSFSTVLLNNFEYILLFLFSITSMLFLISAYDFLTVYLTIELQALSFYVLAASKRSSEFSTEAGLKYFLLGAFSSGLLLFGMAFLYGFTGMIHFSDLFLYLTLPMGEDSSVPIFCGFLFLFFGFLFKLTAAPFHIWAPDVYEGAPTGITAFFATLPKAALLPPFWRIFFLTTHWNVSENSLEKGGPENGFLFSFLVVSIFLSIGLGTFAALGQRKIKRLIAYSSIAHIGFILLGFVCESFGGLQSIFIYYPIYMITTLGIFSILTTPLWSRRLSGREEGIGGKYITDFAGLGKRQPILSFIFSIFFFSLAGIPPLAGFYSKAFLFFAALLSGMFFLGLFGIAASVCSCFYYIRFIRIFYFEKETTSLQLTTTPLENSYLTPLTFLFIAFQPLWWEPLYSYTGKIGSMLYIL
jgi:proton-translocating NADH-quinone oxidoreductase chain N